MKFINRIRYSLFVLFLIVLNNIQAQIGVNIENINSSEVFYVDPKKNTGSGSVNQYTDDVWVNNSGNMSIGFENTDASISNAKLHVNGNIKINDASVIKEGDVLVSDAVGITSWAPLIPAEVVTGQLNDNGVALHTGVVNEFVDVTTKRITLSPGKWLVEAKMSTRYGAVSTVCSWIRLLKQGSPDIILNTMGVIPEGQGGLIATPSLSYLVDVPTNSTYYIAMCNPCNCAVTLSLAVNPRYGGSYFYAVKLH